MRRDFRRAAACAVLALIASITPLATAHAQADAWWHHITVLAEDSMRGRQTGSPGDKKAIDYIAAQFARDGLAPGGTNGFLQPVQFVSRRIDEPKSNLSIVRKGVAEPIVLGDEATIGMRSAPASHLEAPVVFVGYGLTVPELKYDDLAGLDLHGKLVLLVTGGPPNIPGPLLAHYQNVRWEALKRAGAIGVLSIPNPKGMDIPWDRSKLSRFMPQMSLADPSLSEAAGAQLTVSINPARADKLFAGSGHAFAQLMATADSGKPLPRFALPIALRANVTTVTTQVTSYNVVGILAGSDPALSKQYVVLTAHHDHVGVGVPIKGDSIYNGAMDDASGIATLLETAAAFKVGGARRPKRSLVFLAVTAEEKGLLGSRYYARHPTVPASNIVADVNVDMPLPLFPLKSIIAQGLEESDLGDDLRHVAAPLSLRVLGDPEPLRNAFTRSDQYSFIREGVPSISLKVGFDAGSPEHEIVKKWRAERYHAPSDDLLQPIDRQSASDFNRVYLKLVEGVADRATKPQWNANSFFKRFAKPTT
jgi:Zn-dependent M28 family amino/carboxypeptidase